MRYLLALLIGLSFFACGEEEETELSVSIPQNNQLFFGSTYSCYSLKGDWGNEPRPRDVEGPYHLSIRTLQLDWKSIDTLEIASVQIYLDHPRVGGRIKCILDPLEVNFLFKDGVSSGTYEGGLIRPATKDGTAIRSTSDCRITCGGISLAEEDTSFTGTGEIIIRGTRIKRDENGDETLDQLPVNARGTFQFQYDGIY